MGRSSNVFARVEPETKEQAERVLDESGVSMPNAVGMFLRQVVMHRGLPFDVKLPQGKPLSYETLTKVQFDAEIEKEMADIKAGSVYSADTVVAQMRRDYSI